ncbi:polysaccharide export protein [Bradyrhizobium rifense]|uniref:Polysaccharide export protein n=1 Tax=Bradyrhizobium rifense TaxID=515499 RepID=A0A5D3K7U3_9BRAD|nr:polysaccharide biosynthesis/export family protein [Bradyrhizobium rifense]TYL92022.1 polysaccharide export protein [Bradyrhizobium rifense]
MHFRLVFLTALISSLVGGCGIMPVAGPQSWDITSGQSEFPYALVRLRPETMKVLAAHAPRIAGRIADRRGPQRVVVEIGDILGVTVYETGAGLFVQNDLGVRPGNFFTVPPQAVGPDGNITVPSAGPIQAKGHTTAEIESEIVAALKKRSLEPNAVVTLLEQRSSAFTVLGDVRAAGRYPANAGGEHLLEAIGRAGGLLGAGNESWVVLERSGKKAVAPFGALIDEPANNIYVRPRDMIYVYREPQTFLAFGASGRQGQFPFEAWRVSMSEAIAKATGLSDQLADPASVFLYRGETREVAEQLGVDISRFEGPVIPIIYQADLRDAGGYFLTSSFEMRNKDVIYISNAASVESTKFLTFVRTIVATAQDPVSLANSAKALSSGTATTIVTQPISTGH